MLVAVLLIAPWSSEIAEANGSWRISGDLRGIYAADWRDTRTGQTDHGDVAATRFRLRLRRELAGRWAFQTRLAANAASENNDFDVFLRTARQTGTSVTPGSATLDEFFIAYRGVHLNLRIGRMQTKISLPLVTGKSLDRKEASNTNIGWTDGVEVEVPIAGGWQGLVIAQYNGPRGNGIPTRGPLDFSDSGSRIGWFGGVLNERTWGPIFQRVLGVTWFPESLARDGIDAPARDDYVTVTAKLAAGWELGDAVGLPGARLVLAGELGHALNRPARSAVGLANDRDAGGTAFQAGADLADFVPGHTLGLALGRLPAGWLISNDFRPNEDLVELRYVWLVNDRLQFDVRGRVRREREVPAAAETARRDRDVRTRLTWRF